jgi:hypothetical protein
MRAEIEAFLDAHPPLASEYTFTNLYAWAPAVDYRICRYGDGFLIRRAAHGTVSFLAPLVADDPRGAVEACFDACREGGHLPMIERVGEDALAALPCHEAGWRVEEDRDNFDYVYALPDLLELKGDRYHDKKNLLGQFHRKYVSEYRPLTPAMVPECLALAHDWCEDRHCEQDESLSQESCAVARMLAALPDLRCDGGALFVDGRMVAFMLGERLNPETLVMHVQKGDTRFAGVYQAIQWEYLNHAAPDVLLVNAEQDLGVPGLRKSKTSYHPVRMVRKYRLWG